MGSKTVLFDIEETKTPAEAAAFLRDMADKIEAAVLDCPTGAMNLAGTLTLEAKATEKIKEGRAKRCLEIEMEWVEIAAPAAGAEALVEPASEPVEKKKREPKTH
jgi:amphi-Trp domain-containing protein